MGASAPSFKGEIMKEYLCIEHGEYFIIEAKSFEEAKEMAALWGAECIRELTGAEAARCP
jgi:hypothetical protein